MPSTMKKIPGAIDSARQGEILASYASDPKNAIVRHALSRHAITSVFYDPSHLPDVNMSYSLELPTRTPRTTPSSPPPWAL